MKTTLFLFALVGCLAFSACPHPGPNPEPITPGKVISCISNSVQAHAPEVLPQVNECLAGTSDITSCLWGLVKPAVGVTIDVIACVVRHEGRAAAMAASDDTSAGTREMRRAQRAREFLEKGGFEFAEQD